MDKQLDIIIWAFPSWNGDYMKSTVELAKELALRHRILYIDYSYTVKDLITRRGAEGIPTPYILGRDHGLREVTLANEARVYVLSLPPILPVNWVNNNFFYKIFERINFQILAPRVTRAIDALQFDTNVVINAFNPFMGKATAEIFDHRPIIYYCYDNIAASRWASRHGARLEKDFAEKADAVIYTSETLRAEKHYKVPEYIVTNGVDLRNFQHCAPHCSRADNKKVIGYVGTVDDRLDYELLEELIRTETNYDFHFIGRMTSGQWHRLMRYPNATFSGAVNPDLLPGMMATFDVGIIPFMKNDFTRNIYPMKVNEYLAMGMPVVATDFAKLPDLEPYMSVAGTSAAFGEALASAIASDNDTKKAMRRAKASSNSWEHKARELENILMHHVNIGKH